MADLIIFSDLSATLYIFFCCENYVLCDLFPFNNVEYG